MTAADSPALQPSLLSRVVSMRPGEGKLVAWAWVYLFAVFTAYYVIRPIRDEAGVAGGVDNLSWLFTGTLLAMMAVNPPFAALVARLPRVRFIGITYRFFMLNLLVFLVLFRTATGDANVWVGRAFFIWTSVFNLFVVSVFWAFMVDVFTTEQGKRLFGFIAAAATVGGIVGAGVTATTVQSLGVPTLLLVAVLLLELGVFASRRLGAIAPALATPAKREELSDSQDDRRRHHGRPDPCPAARPYLLEHRLYMLLYTVLSTFLYFQQAAIVDASFRRPRRPTRVLRPHRPAGQRPDDRRAALPHRPGHEAARRGDDADHRPGGHGDRLPAGSD